MNSCNLATPNFSAHVLYTSQAAIVGLHQYKSILDLFEKYLYQDLEPLYEMDLGE